MAVLLENQAKELLRESNTMAGGDVEGFAAVAFPIVRRVFGGLLAQKLVSVQPMSLPSGLVFLHGLREASPDTLEQAWLVMVLEKAKTHQSMAVKLRVVKSRLSA